jgi:hypothetical protein
MKRGLTVVVGAGPAGMAAAAMLRRHGIDAVALERGDGRAVSWRGHYDSLRLHTIRSLSSLPGFPLPRSLGRRVSRDEFVAYLEVYAARHRLAIRTDTTVLPSVIVATGYTRAPVIPDWPGREGFGGRVLHSGEYRNAEPFRGLQVLVVGAGNSGSDIALDLAAGGAPAGVAFGAAAALPGAAPGARRPGAGRRARPAPAANAGLRRACGIGAARVHRQPRRPPAAGHREPRSSAVAAARGRCRSSMRGSFPGCATARFGSSLGSRRSPGSGSSSRATAPWRRMR